ncbi:hypothetical protein NQ314_000823 [Rhamnusium bicolor]|uniref:Uncharacterized protein n=1 Tax=Rhamnusium bicolor TaxID=1586634 RepID=A0AAV8ZW27_9CUCU|nr:hypothetical protein NQ314_000823 [Rhamnusium bicolor]
MINRETSGIPKNEFPVLLKQCFNNMDEVPPKDVSKEKSAIKQNLISGFDACGLVPFNPDRVLRKLPNDSVTVNVETEVTDRLTKFLRIQRYTVTKSPCLRNKMLIEQDVSVTLELNDDETDGDISSDEGEPLEYIQPTLINIVIDKFVLVKFLSGSRKKPESRYVCLIKNVLDDFEFEVVGLKSAQSRRKC